MTILHWLTLLHSPYNTLLLPCTKLERFRLSNVWTVREYNACEFMYADVPFRCCVRMWAFFTVLTSGSCCGEVRMILWPTLPQPNPFLTVPVDPNGPTQTSWCRGDVLPWHRYRLYRQTVAWEPGLLLLGAFRETPHNSEGKPIKKYQSMWLVLLSERTCDLSIYKCVHLHMDLQSAWQAKFTQTYFLHLYSMENIFLCTRKQEVDKKVFYFLF